MISKNFLITLCTIASTCLAAQEDPTKHPRREFFYAGGEYTNITTRNVTSQVKVGQIYVEKLTPQAVTQEHPIVFIAGRGQTGTNFLETPDGRTGWASFFLEKGYVVYLTDQPSRGRSPWHPSIGSIAASGTSDIERLFTGPQYHDLWPQSKLHTQWPGSGKAGDRNFDAFYASQVPSQTDPFISEAQNTKAYTALLDRIGAAHILTHSQSGQYGWAIGNARPTLVKSIMSIEPNGPPFKLNKLAPGPDRPWGLTYYEIAYEPSAGSNATLLETVNVTAKDVDHNECIMQIEPAKKLKHLSQIPVIVVTGEASYHAPYDYCTVNYLRQAGVQVEYADLGAEGIHGNGHMLFMEKNNLEIAQRVFKWLQRP
ncbi:Alpha/Beta hydrolase protein [Phaeosphaeriaceae sp. PMI808]|nr:Alpha/Beta hydrolase protein [Phaeosphaeriaceae sp. PMI808]